jgi:hypothetical protein
MLSSWNQSLTISCVSYVSAAASDYQRVRRILQTYAYTYMFRGRILRTPRIRTCVDRGLVSAYFCCMRILHCTCIWDTAYSFFAVYVSVCGYKLYPCVTRLHSATARANGTESGVRRAAEIVKDLL